MTENNLEGFGNIDETSKELQSKGGDFAKFGLNTGIVTKLEFNENAGAEGSPSDAIDLTVEIKGKEQRRRFYNITKVFSSSGEEISQGHKEYADKYNKDMLQLKATVTHIIKAFGVTSEQIVEALKIVPKSFKEWAETLLNLLPSDFNTVPVDVFLEFQWKISKSQDRTWEQLPKNMKGGYFLCKSIEPNGKWTEQRAWKDKSGKQVLGLRYIDDRENVHMFTRSDNFMNSKKAYKQSLDNVSADIPTEDATSAW